MSTTLKIFKIGDLKTERARKDGKVLRQFFSVQFKNVSGIFDESTALTRNFFQRHNAAGDQAYWTLPVPYEQIKKAEGQSIEGTIIQTLVPPYLEVIGGVERLIRKRRAVVLPHENVNVVIADIIAEAQAKADSQAEPAPAEQPAVVDNENKTTTEAPAGEVPAMA